MEKHESRYETLKTVGEGSYGVVTKCRHKETGQLVAIKKFLDSDDERTTQKIVNREIRMLRKLRHENLVNLIEVIKRKRRTQLVFEFVDQTVLDELERCQQGMAEEKVREIIFQVLRGIDFCHNHNVIHRDIKPENILISKSGVVKLCDFGFARSVALHGEAYTEYVATRWYRAPELLVGDAKYGKPIDVWAVGCLHVELLTGDPIFPGDSDLDQLNRIIKVFGNINQRHREMFYKNPLFHGLKLVEVRQTKSLREQFPRLTPHSLDFMRECLQLEADDRPTCSQLLRHHYFTHDGFAHRFTSDLKARIQQENAQNPLLRLSGIRRTRETKDEETKESIILKEKKKKKKEMKENTEEKPRKKHSETEKIGRRHSPQPGVSQPAQETTETSDISMPPIQVSGSHHHMSSFGGSHPYNPSSLSITGMVDSWSHSYRSSFDKGKKPIHASYLKKSNTNHQSLAINPQSSLLSEKATHEKGSLGDKGKRKPLKEENRAGRHLSFPEVKGAEGHQDNETKRRHTDTVSEPGDTKTDTNFNWEVNTIGDSPLVEDICAHSEEEKNTPTPDVIQSLAGDVCKGLDINGDTTTEPQKTEADLDNQKDYSPHAPQRDSNAETTKEEILAKAAVTLRCLESKEDSETKTHEEKGSAVVVPKGESNTAVPVEPVVHFPEPQVRTTTPGVVLLSSANKRRRKTSQRVPTPKVQIVELKQTEKTVRTWSSEWTRLSKAQQDRRPTRLVPCNQWAQQKATNAFKPQLVQTDALATYYAERERIAAAIQEELARRKAAQRAQEALFVNRMRRMQAERKRAMERNLQLVYAQGYKVNMGVKMPQVKPVIFTRKKKQSCANLVEGTNPYGYEAKRPIYLKRWDIRCGKQFW